MSAAEKLDLPTMSFADFVEFERTSDVKHEIWDDVLVAIAGASKRHEQVSMNVQTNAAIALNDGSTCEVFGPNLMVFQPSVNKGVYPDLSVVCGEQEFEQDSAGEDRVLLNPTLVVEVLSRSTAARDIGAKFQRYQSIPSLKEYVLIDPTTPFVQSFRSTETGWVVEMVTEIEADVTFNSIGVTMAMGAIYRRVELSDRSDVIPSDAEPEESGIPEDHEPA